MASADLQRRQLLKALGAGAASLPFFSLLSSSAVQAQEARPLRLLLLYQGWGGTWDGLRPRGLTGNDAALTEASLTFTGSALQPLAKFASKMTVVEGLAYTTGLIAIDATKPIDSRTFYIGHDHPAPNAFTGSRVVDSAGDALPQGPSLDFVLGQALGGSTAVRNLQIGMGGYVAATMYDSLSYNATGQRLPGFGKASDVLRLLFANAQPSGDPRAADKKKSVLHAVQASAQRLRSRLASPERAKLDEHLAALADVEQRLNAQSQVVCSEPAMPGQANDVIAATRDQLALVRQAFACDRTRFVSGAWNVGGAPIPGVLPAGITDMHGQVAHMLETAGAPGAEARENVAKVQRWHAQQLADFMTSLEATPDGAGTLLDNTLIVWAQDFGPDIHGGLNVPFVLLGGAQGRLKMGRYLRAGAPLSDNFASGAWRSYVPHNKLLVSVMNAFGVSGDTFGSNEVMGGLPGL